jgi:hypothetical protein
MPKGEMFTAAYDIRTSEIFSSKSLLGVERGERRLVVHAGDARLHSAHVTRGFSDDTFLRIAPHLPYSPNLTPSDFFLLLVQASQKPPPRTAIQV